MSGAYTFIHVPFGGKPEPHPGCEGDCCDDYKCPNDLQSLIWGLDRICTNMTYRAEGSGLFTWEQRFLQINRDIVWANKLIAKLEKS